MTTIIHKETIDGFAIEVLVGLITDYQFYNECLNVRRKAYSQKDVYTHKNDFFALTDVYSKLFLFKKDGNAIGTLSVTDRKSGPLDCEQFYPSHLLQLNGVFSSNKLAFIKNTKLLNGDYLSVYLLNVCTGFVVNNGLELDVINIDTRMTEYYKRIGYAEIPEHEFLHPVFKNPTTVMFKSLTVEADGIVKQIVAEGKIPTL